MERVLCGGEPRVHSELNRITCPNHTRSSCAGENICLHPCNRHFLPTQRPTFFYENAPSDPETKLWIEVVPSSEAKQLYFNQVSSGEPLYKHTLTPGSSGRIELGPIPEPGPGIQKL
ncbi:hypothetical protein, conserved [Eimeria acervulina]|uniref:Uncharacterized protein n=1 Tax=Eimeria acervulina TaxID=5801 RepID=U6GRN0_EIMAC|nr:hypothetical protein, conserved [Eimeria acervulina]CDI82840.1 hypothetical protein, conserved [Eimeria acervulina]